MTMAKRTPEDVARRVREIMVQELGDNRSILAGDHQGVVPASLTDEARLDEDLNADSLERIELIMAYEKEFGIEIPDEDVDPLKTVGDTIKYLQGRVEAKQIKGAWGKS